MEDHGVAVEIEAGNVTLCDQIGHGLAVDGDKVTQRLAGDGRGAEVNGGDRLEVFAVLALKVDAERAVHAVHGTGLDCGDTCLAVDREIYVVIQRQIGQLLRNARGRARAPDKACLDGNRGEIRGLEHGMIIHVESQIEIQRAVGAVLIGVAGALERQITQHILDLAHGHVLIGNAVLDKRNKDLIGVVLQIVVPAVLGQSLRSCRYTEADLAVGHARGLKGIAVARLHFDLLLSRYRNGDGGNECAQHNCGEHQT